jgi:adenylate cyclase class 2
MATVEIEARYRIESALNPAGLLAAMGICFGDPIEQDDQAYAPSSWNYGMPRLGIPFARLRTQVGEHLFTVKTPITDVRTCVEQETPIADRDAMHEAILMMGFKPTVRIQKSRRISERAGMTLCLDSVDGVGDFLEVEIIVDDSNADLEQARFELESFVDSLSLNLIRVYESYDTLVRDAQSSRTATAA